MKGYAELLIHENITAYRSMALNAMPGKSPFSNAWKYKITKRLKKICYDWKFEIINITQKGLWNGIRKAEIEKNIIFKEKSNILLTCIYSEHKDWKNYSLDDNS